MSGETFRTGRRVERTDELELPGDYCRVEMGVYNSDEVYDEVHFLLPVDPDEPGIPEWGRRRHMVRQPPHVFTEMEDGSLQIRESIGCGGGVDHGGFYWHGYLDAGHVWRRLPN